MDIVLLAKQTASAINIAKYIKNSQNIMDKSEQKLKLADLIEALADIKMEIAEIKSTLLEKDEKILELEKKLNLKENLVFERPYYWIYNDTDKEGPFCPKCYDVDKKLIHLHGSEELYSCLECKLDFLTPFQIEQEAKQALKAIKNYQRYNR